MMQKKLKKAIICDIDGTLAFKNDRNPFDETLVMSDSLNTPIKDLINLLYNNSFSIIILSGRSDKSSDLTIKWLQKHQILYHYLYFRKAGDQRKDSVVKKEIYHDKIESNFDVKMVLDDRNQVVDMWRKELGLTCLQVNYGDF